MTRSTPTPNRAPTLVAVCLAAALAGSCATVEGLRAIADLEIEFDRISDAVLAGVELDRVRSYRDLRPADALRLAAAVSAGSAPFGMLVHLDAENPSASAARVDLLTLDWTLVLEGRDTVTGVYVHEEAIAPGTRSAVRVPIELDLLQFFGDDLEALVEIAAGAAGAGGREPDVALRVRPALATPLGPVRYPREVLVRPDSR